MVNKEARQINVLEAMFTNMTNTWETVIKFFKNTVFTVVKLRKTMRVKFCAQIYSYIA